MFKPWKETRNTPAARGFTLVELLVVIAIMSLLLAILMPALARARENAKTTTCLANQRGIGQAIYLYANQNEDKIVPSNYNGMGGIFWWASLMGEGVAPQTWFDNAKWPTYPTPAYGQKSIFRCPSGLDDLAAAWSNPQAYPASALYPTTWIDPNGSYPFRSGTSPFVTGRADCWYSCVCVPGDKAPTGGSVPDISVPMIQLPTSGAVWAQNKISGLSQPSALLAIFDGVQNVRLAGLNARHNDNTSTNTLFFDGHAETLPCTNAYFPNSFASTYFGIGAPSTAGPTSSYNELTLSNLKKYPNFKIRVDQP